jgi:rare lipoprotein A
MAQNRRRIATLAVGLVLGLATAAVAAVPPPESPAARQEARRLARLPPLPAPHGKGSIDHSGRSQKGGASFYARSFAHKKMANGRHLDPNANVAASKTLPLGTVATIVNTENGKAATVKVEDRGPYVDGRVVDVTPKVAKDLDMKAGGVVQVMVKPIAVPQPDGGVKLGAGAADATQQEVRDAAETSRNLTRLMEASNSSR